MSDPVENPHEIESPALKVLDALFAQIQLEQGVLTRRYMAVTELRGVARRLMREGLPVDLGFAGDVLTMAVPMPGLAAFADVMPGVVAAVPVAAPVAVQAAPVAVPPVPARAAVPRPSSGRGHFSAAWTPEEDAALIEAMVAEMLAGTTKMQATVIAAQKMGRTPKACQSRIFNRLGAQLDAALKGVPGGEAAAQATLRRAVGGTFRGWTEEENARLVQLVADGIGRGLTKGDAVEAAAKVLDRPREGAWFRVLNKARAALDAELARRGLTGAVAAPVRKAQAAAAKLPAAPEPKSEQKSAGLAALESSPEPAVQDVPAAGGGVCGGDRAPTDPLADAPVEPQGGTCKEVLQVAAPVTDPVLVSPVVKESLTLAAPVASTPAPRVGPRPEGRETQVGAPVDLAPVTDHLRVVTKGDAATLKRDFALIHLACANWSMPEIAADLGMDSKAVKQRFEALCGYDPVTKKGRFPRSYVYHGLEALLKLKAVA